MITTVHLIVDQKHYPELIMKVENDIVNIALHISLKNFEQQYNGINIHEAQRSGYLFHCTAAQNF